MGNELTVTTQQGLQYTDAQKDLIRKQFFPSDASDDEVRMCHEMARRSGLDVFRRQCYFWRDPKTRSVVLVASVHGMCAQAVARGATIQSAAVCEADDFLCDPVTGEIRHLFRAAGRGPVIGAWARGKLPGGEVVVRYVAIAEYRRGSPIWSEKPATMIEKVARAHVARALVPDALGNVYGGEEMGVASSDEDGTVTLMPTSTPRDPDAERIRDCLDALADAADLAALEVCAAEARKLAKAERWPASTLRLYKSRLEIRRIELTPRTAEVVDATGDREPGDGE